MNPVRPGPLHLQGLPTLTEVVELASTPREAVAAAPAALPPMAPQEALAGRAVEAAAALELSEQELVERVLDELQRDTTVLLEARLREVLAPVFVRLTETLADDVRLEITATLRDLVARAVSRELLRQRGH